MSNYASFNSNISFIIIDIFNAKTAIKENIDDKLIISVNKVKVFKEYQFKVGILWKGVLI